MDLWRKPNGKWQVRWREGSRRRARTFDRKGDAQNFMAWLRRRQQLGQAAVPEDDPASPRRRARACRVEQVLARRPSGATSQWSGASPRA